MVHTRGAKEDDGIEGQNFPLCGELILLLMTMTTPALLFPFNLEAPPLNLTPSKLA
jgi:hypothetical protein